jgi:Protein of unknown function (DUF1592)/Protein of unknown function (DUF1595)/Protein of unknown function (DUF1588)/Protein of unknown function (DUF1585)/Protein of unknown function (DUF1587)
MIHVRAKRTWVAAIPLLAATFGCTGTVTTPEDSQVDGSNPPGIGGSPGSNGTGSSPSVPGTGTPGGGSTGVGAGGTPQTPGAGATGGQVEGMEPSSGPRPVMLDGQPLFSRFLRLTNDQWERSAREILRLDAPTGYSDKFLGSVAGTTDFANNEKVVIVDNTIAEDFQRAAEALADAVTTTDAALQKVVATNDADTFIKTFGRRAFRRELTADETKEYRAIFDSGSAAMQGTQSAFTKGANWVIATMLQSPHFLYRVEMSDTGAPLSGYEVAAKLSLWIRDTTPSDALLDAASSLTTPDAVGAQVEKLLEDNAAVDVMRKFHAELYKFALFDSIAKTSVNGYTPDMNAEFAESSKLFFDRIYKENLGVRDILTSTVGFVGPKTASIYGVNVSGSGMMQMELPGRVGFFSQAPFLALWARNNEPDSIHRGVRLNLDTLCADPGLPSVVPNPPAAGATQTNREVITNLTSGCAKVCHGELINPIGFAFENFDGLGRMRETDNGRPVDTTGVYSFVEGRIPFSGAPELMEKMASGVQAHQCWAKKMMSYAMERDLVEGDRPLMETLAKTSATSGGSLKQVMVTLAKSDAFRVRAGGAQ